MTFRSGDSHKTTDQSGLKLSNLSEGQIVDGKVKKVEDYGIFIQIGDSKLSGLCHKSQVSHIGQSQLSSLFDYFNSFLIMRKPM
jgi:rRNA biogenesis protein RRP5